MFRLKNVLFPVDFSNRCRGAARVLDALHSHFDVEVTLAHVLTPPHLEYSVADLGGGVIREYTIARTEQVHKDLEYFLDVELQAFHLHRVLLEGDPARCLTEYAQTQQMDMIVMPTHGYGGFRRFLLGSITAKVLHDAKCPVLTGIHMEDIPEPEDIHVRKVGVALDLNHACTDVLEWAVIFARNAGAALEILHVTPSLEGLSGGYLEPNWRERFAEEAAARIAEIQKQVGIDAPVRIRAGDVAVEIAALANSNGFGMLVTGRGSRDGAFSGIRAHAYGIIRHSPCPVISV